MLSPTVDKYLDGDDTGWEKEPLERLGSEGLLASYWYTGFWQPMDAVRNRDYLIHLRESGNAP